MDSVASVERLNRSDSESAVALTVLDGTIKTFRLHSACDVETLLKAEGPPDEPSRRELPRVTLLTRDDD